MRSLLSMSRLRPPDEGSWLRAKCCFRLSWRIATSWNLMIFGQQKQWLGSQYSSLPPNNKTSPLLRIGTILGGFNIGGLGGLVLGGRDYRRYLALASLPWQLLNRMAPRAVEASYFGTLQVPTVGIYWTPQKFKVSKNTEYLEFLY